MALFSNKKNIKKAKVAAGQMQAAGIRAMESTKAQEARNLAGEEAKLNIFNLLGAEGTYGSSPPSGGGGGGAGGSVFDTSGTGLSEKDQKLRAFADWGGLNELEGSRQGIIDPEAYAEKVSGSTLFRLQSQQVAEANQLVNREGKLWDQLNQSITGQIYEGAALQLRDTLRQLKNNMAKGGTARRAAANEFNVIQANERAIQMRTKEAWQANLKLHDHINQNVDRVLQNSKAFVEGLPLLNASYRDAMQKNAQLQVQANINAAQIAQGAYATRMGQQAVDFGTKLAEGVILAVASIALSYAGGAIGGAMASTGAAAGGAGAITGTLSGAGGAAMGAAAGGALGDAVTAAGQRQSGTSTYSGLSAYGSAINKAGDMIQGLSAGFTAPNDSDPDPTDLTNWGSQSQDAFRARNEEELANMFTF